MPNLWPHFHFPRAGAFSLAAALALGALSPAALRAEDQDVGAPHITASAELQMRAIVGIKQGKTGVQKKIDSRLYMGLLHRRGDARLAPLTSFQFVKAGADDRIDVDIPVASAGVIPEVVRTIVTRGGVVLKAHYDYRLVRARIHFEDLEPIASIPGVRQVANADRPYYSAVNVSEGATTHAADEARVFFATNGTGIKIGVLSDGVDSLAALQASGDLPAGVTVLPGQAGDGDEGCAMLEIVHDLAPGAQLYYATAAPTQAQFAQNILDLAAAGCQIIVDDVIYFAESPFQDGPIAQAVNTVTANGVLFFSSAGNEGNIDDGTSGTWEGDFNPNGTPPVLAGAGPVHNFGNGGQSVLVTAASVITLLSWAEHRTLSQGFATTDYDLYEMNNALTAISDASTNTQDGVGGDDFPIEIMFGADVNQRLVVARFAAGTTSTPPMFNLIAFRGSITQSLATTGATRGHSAAANAFSVAAVPALTAFPDGGPTGPYPGLYGPSNTTELFTSDGPRRILLRPDGSEITPGNRTKTGGIVRAKPDIAAADGVACAAPGFNPFFGTSAAAPHAAAIAALLKSALPGISPAEVRDALMMTAIDIETPGADRDTGVGLVMAHAALDRAGAPAPIKPEPIEVDAHVTAGDSSNHNGVLEPGEIVQIAPTWRNNQAGNQPLSGVATGFTGPAGPFYSLANGSADYGTLGANSASNCNTATADCYLFGVAGTRPLAHWDATFTETLNVGLKRLWKLHLGNTFPDVPSTNPFYPYIENLIHNGVTGGCGLGNYCPANPVTRAQMAVFLLKGKHGAMYIPPPCTGVFTDVPCTPASAFAVDWIEQLAEEGITGGCGPNLYCPGNPVTRAQMAVFLLKAEHGSGYVPPACTGIFPDVACTPTPAFAVDWIEQLFHEGITGGCAGGGYCPANPVLRSQMAVFLVKTFGLNLYGL